MFDYFYGHQIEQYSFYRLPKLLFFFEDFRKISNDAKLLYSLLLDRMVLSAKNGWLDKQSRVYIIYTVKEIKWMLNCSDKKAIKILNELEKDCGLIERKKQGLGKPNVIYVKNFASGFSEEQLLKCKKYISGDADNAFQEVSKVQRNNTDIKNNEFSNTNPILSSDFYGRDSDRMSDYEEYYQYFYDALDMEYLKKDYPYDSNLLEFILQVLTEVMISKRKEIRIASDDKPIELVKSSFMKLDMTHIKFVMDSFESVSSDVRNVKQYLLASLYNAPMTIDAHYSAMYRHDHARGLI